MKISVVIPLYQKAAYVGRCLDSVARQTLEGFEVIVVDDGSTDGGGDVVGALRSSRVRLIRQRNLGPGAARNRGIAEARGEWVAFLDADDEWRPRFLEVTSAVAAGRPGVDAVFTNILHARVQRPLLQMGPGGEVPDYFAFLLSNDGLGMTSMATLAKRSALLAAGGFREDVMVGEDHDAFARLAWRGVVSYVPEPLSVYHADIPDSSMARSRQQPPVFPATVTSFREFREQGRIPAALAASSQRVIDKLVLDHAAALTNIGRRGEARLVLARDCEPSAKATRRHLWLRLRAVLPVPVHRLLRFLFGARPRSPGLAGLPKGGASAPLDLRAAGSEPWRPAPLEEMQG